MNLHPVKKIIILLSGYFFTSPTFSATPPYAIDSGFFPHPSYQSSLAPQAPVPYSTGYLAHTPSEETEKIYYLHYYSCFPNSSRLSFYTLQEITGTEITSYLSLARNYGDNPSFSAYESRSVISLFNLTLQGEVITAPYIQTGPNSFHPCIFLYTFDKNMFYISAIAQVSVPQNASTFDYRDSFGNKINQYYMPIEMNGKTYYILTIESKTKANSFNACIIGFQGEKPKFITNGD